MGKKKKGNQKMKAKTTTGKEESLIEERGSRRPEGISRKGFKAS